MGTADSGVRPGWIRDVELPRSLDELRGPTTGVVRLPLRLYWSGPDPRAVEWSLTEQADCRWLYEIVLREGTLDGVRGLVDGVTLVRVWDELYLPPHVRHAWQPMIDSARAAA
ncbi:MAG TPA: hypothetical protein VFQ77_05135 [Pseudonocardiaceae bacterium]|nr:hypothetical protein [Pseudonocardiaceae bacterium]